MPTETVANSSKIDALGSKRVARKFGFTKKKLDSLPLPENGQRSYYYDSATRGLALAVSPAGKKIFVLYRKIAGRPERITLGGYPDLNIDQARGAAAKENAAIAKGENPADKRRVVRDEMTLGELFDRYLEEWLKPRGKRWENYEGLHRLHLQELKSRKISSIRKAEIISLHARIGTKSGQPTANRCLTLLSVLFNKALDWEWKGFNPTRGIEPFPENSRERFLQPEEFPQFFKALEDEGNETVRDYVWVSLWTGARRSNVQSMRWEEINFHAATWTIPAAKSKSGKPMTVTLPTPAIAILEQRKASSKSEWVFPSSSETGHLVEPKSAWKRILDRAGIKDLRIHDLRRTLGSWQATEGASLEVIGKSLGHQSTETTKIYARLNLTPVRASVDKATAAMMLASKRKPELLGDGNG